MEEALIAYREAARISSPSGSSRPRAARWPR
jgi:hypothetical protein